MSDAEQEVRRALLAGDLVGAAAWYVAGDDLPVTLGASVAAALDAARLDDLYQVIAYALANDAYFDSDDDRRPPDDLSDVVDQRGFSQLADHWLARLAATPGDVVALTHALCCLDMADRQAERPALVDQILALDPATITDHAIEAAMAALIDGGDLGRAAEVARRHPTAESWLALAGALEEVQPVAATTAYEHALALDPDSSWILTLLSDHLRAAGDVRRADELAARAAVLDAEADGD